MTFKETVGIDISKLTFDARVHTNQCYKSFSNDKEGFNDLVSWVRKGTPFPVEDIIFVFEHTGLYSHQLALFLDSQGILFCMVSGLEIKRSLGIIRGKDDKKDATKIAQYAYRLRDELEPTVLATEDATSLKRLLSLRERLVKQRSGYKSSLKEYKRVLPRKENDTLFRTQEKIIAYLSKQISSVEQQMDCIVKENDEMKQNYDLATSIKGIGGQTALFLIAYTANFTKFKNARKFASYCGIAPFPNTSGTSIRGRNKVSHLANKKIKSLLDMCAKTSIQHNPEMKVYYQKRIAEGKNKMSTINIVRNKLVARIFAVVKRQQPYVNLMKYSA